MQFHKWIFKLFVKQCHPTVRSLKTERLLENLEYVCVYICMMHKMCLITFENHRTDRIIESRDPWFVLFQCSGRKWGWQAIQCDAKISIFPKSDFHQTVHCTFLGEAGCFPSLTYWIFHVADSKFSLVRFLPSEFFLLQIQDVQAA